MTGTEAIAYIEALSWSESKPGLERTKALLAEMGNPQEKLTFIHVAGTNGKGSFCAMLDSILRKAGFRCGLYTSPYIQHFCERIQVDGNPIASDDLGRITQMVKGIADALEDHPTQFEMITAVAFQYFYEAQVDVVVLETGLGGRLDSTNVIPPPVLACITNIGLEHTDVLGHTLAQIAGEKAGIIKPGSACICYDGAPEAVQVIAQACKKLDVSLTIANFDRIQKVTADWKGQTVLWDGYPIHLALLGNHQIKNAAMVLTAVEVLRTKGWSISESAVVQGLSAVQWPARLEVLSENPLFILDGGHNPQCAQALTESLDTLVSGKKVVFLCGFLADKDVPGILDLVMPYGHTFICLTPDSPRALEASQLADWIVEKGGEAEAYDFYSVGIRRAIQLAQRYDLGIVAFGSLYMAGAIRTLVQDEARF